MLMLQVGSIDFCLLLLSQPIAAKRSSHYLWSLQMAVSCTFCPGEQGMPDKVSVRWKLVVYSKQRSGTGLQKLR